MNLTPDCVHYAHVTLTPSPAVLATRFACLSPDEKARADQFHFPQHRMHFIAARGFLRQVLGGYLQQPPDALVFSYGTHKKPFLGRQGIQFNLAHSGELALLAIGTQHPLGVDLEYMQAQAKMDVAERFFSQDEIHFLKGLSGNEQRDAFYRVWARKEAVVKAIGTGIQQSLSSFTVPFDDAPATLSVDHETWLLTPLSIHPDYQAALATHPEVNRVLQIFWDESNNAPVVQK